MKKLMVSLFAILAMFAVSACDTSSSKKTNDPPSGTYEGTWDWSTFDDQKNPKDGTSAADIKAGNYTPVGKSEISMVKATEDGKSVYIAEGQLKTGFEYPFAGLIAIPDDAETVSNLKKAVGISFMAAADKTMDIDVKFPQDDIKGPLEGGDGDSAFYYKKIHLTTAEKEFTINISDIAQPSDWGAKKPFKQNLVDQINWQTTQSAGFQFEFRIWDLKLLMP